MASENSLYSIKIDEKIHRKIGLEFVNDNNPPELSAIQIEPLIINHTTTHISVSLNATDESGIKSLWLLVCDEFICYVRVNMTLGVGGRWNATAKISTFIESINELYLKVTAEDKADNMETYIISTYIIGTEENNSKTSETTSSISVLSILLLLSTFRFIKKEKK